MRSKLFFACALALAFIATVASASAQADYAARDAESRYAIGVGISGFNPGWSAPILYGPTVWADYRAPFISRFVSGLAVEGEYHGLVANTQTIYGESSKQNSIGAGLIYHPGILRFHSVRPYVKALGGLGWTPVYNVNGPPFVVTTFGGGADYNLSYHLAIRADYEYQMWGGVPSYSNPGHDGTDNPQGLTLGVLYRFGSRR